MNRSMNLTVARRTFLRSLLRFDFGTSLRILWMVLR